MSLLCLILAFNSYFYFIWNFLNFKYQRTTITIGKASTYRREVYKNDGRYFDKSIQYPSSLDGRVYGLLFPFDVKMIFQQGGRGETNWNKIIHFPQYTLYALRSDETIYDNDSSFSPRGWCTVCDRTIFSGDLFDELNHYTRIVFSVSDSFLSSPLPLFLCFSFAVSRSSYRQRVTCTRRTCLTFPI